MNDIKPEQTLNRRLSHGKINRALCLEAKDRIEELEAGLKAGCEDMADECPARTCGLADKLQSHIEELEAELIEAKCCLVKRERYHKAKLKQVEEAENDDLTTKEERR